MHDGPPVKEKNRVEAKREQKGIPAGIVSLVTAGDTGADQEPEDGCDGCDSCNTCDCVTYNCDGC